MIGNEDFQLDNLMINSSSQLVYDQFNQQDIEEEENQDSAIQDYEKFIELQENNLPHYIEQNDNNNKMGQKQLKRIQNYQVIPQLLKNNKTINIFTGIQITDDGVFRCTQYLDAVSFGFHQQRVHNVEELKNLNLVNVEYSIDRDYERNSFEEAFNFLYQINSSQYLKIYDKLTTFQVQANEMYQYLDQVLPDNLIFQRDVEYRQFIFQCFQYLEKFVQENPNQMFKYRIERLNLSQKDPEITHSGYSKDFLELIGLNANSLTQLVHRGKKIDLVQNKLDITLQSILGLNEIEKDPFPNSSYISYIVTFDGFPIKLYQNQKYIRHGYKPKIDFGKGCEYSLSITIMDVDIFDLEQLIFYRQKLVNNHQNLSIDDFLRKELSYLFEDVEYSVHSQDFIDKYYKTNINQLQTYKQNKNNKNNNYKICKYKFINQS